MAPHLGSWRHLGRRYGDILRAQGLRLGGWNRPGLVVVLAVAGLAGPYATAWELASWPVNYPVGYWPWPVSLGVVAWYSVMATGWALFAAASWMLRTGA